MYYNEYHPYGYQPNEPNLQSQAIQERQYIEEESMRQQNTQVLNALIKALEGESEAIEFYTRLANVAPNKFARDTVEKALRDERTHLKIFTELYEQLTGREPIYQTKRKQFRNFKEGIFAAYQDELEAYETYRNNYLMTKDQMVRDTFFHALTDEIEHASRFAFLYPMV